MRFKNKQKCDECGKLFNNLRIYKSKSFLCWNCYCKKVMRIWIGKKK